MNREEPPMSIGETCLPLKNERANSLLSQNKVAIIREELVEKLPT